MIEHRKCLNDPDHFCRMCGDSTPERDGAELRNDLRIARDKCDHLESLRMALDGTCELAVQHGRKAIPLLLCIWLWFVFCVFADMI